MVKALFSSVLFEITSGSHASVSAKTVGDLIEKLTLIYGGSIKERLFDQKGELIRFWQIFVNGVNIRFLDHLDTELHEDDEVAFLPAVNGG